MDVVLEVPVKAHHVLAQSQVMLEIAVVLLVALHVLAYLLRHELAMTDSVRVNAHLNLLVLVNVMHWILTSVHLHQTLRRYVVLTVWVLNLGARAPHAPWRVKLVDLHRLRVPGGLTFEVLLKM